MASDITMYTLVSIEEENDYFVLLPNAYLEYHIASKTWIK